MAGLSSRIFNRKTTFSDPDSEVAKESAETESFLQQRQSTTQESFQYSDQPPLVPRRLGSSSTERTFGKKSRTRFLSTVCVLTALLIVAASLFGVYCWKYYELKRATFLPDWKVSFASDQVELNFQYNAVASDATVCGILGAHVLNVLRGNAMDAAVSTALCIGAANPHSAGIGGGSMLMYYDRTSRSVTTFNYREKAPGKASRDMFKDQSENASTVGGLAIAVPGEIKGLSQAHSQFGRLPWNTLVLLVVQLLRNGTEVTKAFADAIRSERVKNVTTPLTDPLDTRFEALKNSLINPDTGRYYVEGDVRKDPQLAKTFEAIAENPDSFYTGSLVNDIIGELRESGSIISESDLRGYETITSKPVVVNLASSSMRLFAMPPPSSGAVVAFVLNVLDGYRMDARVKDKLPRYVDFHHRLLEVLKFADAKRSELGDPEFVSSISNLLSYLTSPESADSTRAKISDSGTLSPSEYFDRCYEWRAKGGTTHLSVVDSEGNAVSVTSTINHYFGSLIRGSRTGIFYNNQMDDFSKPKDPNQSPNNFIKPNKRPASSAAPTFVTDMDGNLEVVIGAAGGARIVSAVASTLARMIFLNESVMEATNVFRLYQQCNQTTEYNEKYFRVPKDIIDGLETKGHKLTNMTQHTTVVEAIALTADGKLQASGDAHKASRPSGH